MSATLKKLEQESESDSSDFEGPSENDRWKHLSAKSVKNFKLCHKSERQVIFPKWRELYLKSVWNNVKDFMKSKGIKAEMDLIQGTISVATTRQTDDPWSIQSAHQYINALARGVTYDKAKLLFDDGMTMANVTTAKYCANKERYVKRKQRLLGQDGNTKKALELLTKTHIVIEGKTVIIIGPHKGVREAERAVIDTMENKHPVYIIKHMMMKKQLLEKPELKDESWDRFLPQINKSSQQQLKKRKKKAEWKNKSEKSLFPPEPKPSKKDLEIESGAFFLKEPEKKNQKRAEKRKLQEENSKKKQAKKFKSLVPPSEDKPKKKKKKVKNEEEGESSTDLMKKLVAKKKSKKNAD